MKCQYRNTFPKILVVLFTTLLVGCTCLPFSSPSSKTPIIGAISYSDILTYIGVNVKGSPQWSGWSGITNQDQTLSYSISPDSHYVKINEDTGEITVLANALFSNNFTVTATGYGEFQGSVSATFSVTVIPPFLYNVANIGDDDILMLSGAHPLNIALLGESTYLFVGGEHDDGFSIFLIDNGGLPSYIDSVSDVDPLELEGISSLATTTISGTTYLFAGGYGDDGVSVFSVENDLTIDNVTNVKNGGDLKLDVTSVVTAVEGGTNYLFVTGYVNASGVSVFSVGDDGSLINVDNVGDNYDSLGNEEEDNLKMGGAYAATTVLVGGTNYLFVTGYFDNGMSMFSVGNGGILKNVTNVSDDDIMKIEGARGITTAVVGGNTYVFVAGKMDDGVSVFSVGDDGSLVNVFNIEDDFDDGDNPILEIAGAYSVATVLVEGTTYLFVAGYYDFGISVFSVNDEGSLVNVFNVSDDNTVDDIVDNTLKLRGVRSLTTAVVGETTYLFASGYFDHGVSIFSINP